MIAVVSFKTPDVLDYVLGELDEDEAEVVKAKLAKWIEYEECLTVEFDTDKMTATVKEV